MLDLVDLDPHGYRYLLLQRSQLQPTTHRSFLQVIVIPIP